MFQSKVVFSPSVTWAEGEKNPKYNISFLSHPQFKQICLCLSIWTCLSLILKVKISFYTIHPYVASCKLFVKVLQI